MSAVGPPEGLGLPPTSEEQSLTTSSVASQVPSAGSLLATIQAKHPPRFSGVPILGWIAARFANRAIKNDFIQTMQEKFTEGAAGLGYEKEAAKTLFKSAFTPILSNTQLKDLPLFESLLTTDEGIKMSMEKLQTNPNVRNLGAAFATLPTMNALIGRLRPQDTRAYLQAWIENSSEMEPEDFKSLAQAYTIHLRNAEIYQSRRPEVFDQGSRERGKLTGDFLAMMGTPGFGEAVKRLMIFDVAMRDRTVVDNRQILQYSVASLYAGATWSGLRTIPFLDLRSTTLQGDAEFGLCNQTGIPFTLPEGHDDEVIENFQATVEVYVTDPFSMETRAILLPLPFSGKITVGEARRRLKVLVDVIGDPKNFESAYLQQKPSAHQAGLKELFLEWSRVAAIAFGQALGDFNSTPTRPRETNIRRHQAIAASIQNPQSTAKAVEAAKLRNLFLLQDGTLSLLPSGPGEFQRDIGTLSPTEAKDAKEAFLGRNTSVRINMPDRAADDTEISQANLTLSTHEVEISGSPCLVMETTISVGEKTTTRKSYYRLTDKTQDQVKQETIASGLLTRDILLAKAQFLAEHVK